MTNKEIVLIMKCVNGTPITWAEWMGSNNECWFFIKDSPNFKRIRRSNKNPTYDDVFVYVGPKAEEAT